MRTNTVRLSIVMALFFSCAPAAVHAGQAHHDMAVALHPVEHRLRVADTVTLSDDPGKDVFFTLHAGLSPSSPTPGVRIVKQADRQGAVPLGYYQVIRPAGLRTFAIAYEGTIYHPLEPFGREQARGRRETPGIISGEGVVLSASSSWYPDFGTDLITFDLTVRLPAGWDAVSQGKRSLHKKDEQGAVVRWNSPEPQDDMYVIAARFVEYAKQAGTVHAMVFLRAPDEELAKRYLDATEQYLALYSSLIGPYPYKKFALVENFWETGFGMPSFTLLGPTIIRLPFIINTSYPHEILHNWWGNGVYLDYRRGNWSEGLTAYLSDYLIQEQQGAGAAYRMDTLRKYADYVHGNRDFPLTRFRSRHGAPSEAIGYGKSLLFFHMLRLELGDAFFKRALSDFYRNNKFRFATFDDLRKNFETVSGMDLHPVFEQWIARTGAPQLQASAPAAAAEKDGYLLTATLEQTQPGPAYLLRVPIAVTFAGRKQAFQTTVVMKEKEMKLRLHLDARPLRLDIDPEFDLFRRLVPAEIPPAISQVLGARRMLILLPASADKKLLDAYRSLSLSLSRSGPESAEVKLDSDLRTLPADRSIAILGWENRFLPEVVSSLSDYGVQPETGALWIDTRKVAKKDHSFVFTVQPTKNREQASLFIATDLADALTGLGRKLPHYHKYGYLVFEGREPTNIAKGAWPAADSPLTLYLPDEPGADAGTERGALAAREPLAPRK